MVGIFLTVTSSEEGNHGGTNGGRGVGIGDLNEIADAFDEVTPVFFVTVQVVGLWLFNLVQRRRATQAGTVGRSARVITDRNR